MIVRIEFNPDKEYLLYQKILKQLIYLGYITSNFYRPLIISVNLRPEERPDQLFLTLVALTSKDSHEKAEGTCIGDRGAVQDIPSQDVQRSPGAAGSSEESEGHGEG